MSQNNDPVVASYNVYLKPTQSAANPTSSDGTRRLMVLQYPAHRSATKPYNSSRSQKPISLKHKSRNGLVEVDVPIVTTDHYNLDAGSRFGKALSESRIVQNGGTHGLAGGFSSATAQATPIRNIPGQDEMPPTDSQLKWQTLSGKVNTGTERDPIYFLGSVHGGDIHLSRLDGVVQLRPQLPYIDAEEDLQRQRQLNGSTAAPRAKLGLESPARVDSKAVEMKLKDAKDDARDKGLNENTKILRDIQMERWQNHEWIEESEESVHAKLDLSSGFRNGGLTAMQGKQLRSALNNGDWLDRMSAPREDGKKGLLAKLRGRERERARRKRAEEEKKSRAKAATTTPTLPPGTLLEQSSDSDLSSPEVSDANDDPLTQDLDKDQLVEDVEIKEESELEGRDAQQQLNASGDGATSANERSRKAHQHQLVDTGT